MVNLTNEIEAPLDSKNINIHDNLSSTNTVDNSNNSNSDVANCLALTVKKDYNLSIVKNVMLRTLKNAWRIALSVFTLNFFRFFL